MGYSMEDMFNDEILPKLREITDPRLEEANVMSSPAEEFLELIQHTLRGASSQGDNFARFLIKAVVDRFEEDSGLEQKIRTCFDLLAEECTLRKLEYSNPEGAIVSVDYRGDPEPE